MAEATKNKLSLKGAQKMRPPAARVYLKEQHGIEHTEATLASKRTRGDGPKFIKAGPFVIYTDEALDRYAETYLGAPVTSTSELPPHRRRRPARDPRDIPTSEQLRSG
jgi:hypothetical protein